MVNVFTARYERPGPGIACDFRADRVARIACMTRPSRRRDPDSPSPLSLLLPQPADEAGQEMCGPHSVQLPQFAFGRVLHILLHKHHHLMIILLSVCTPRLRNTPCACAHLGPSTTLLQSFSNTNGCSTPAIPVLGTTTPSWIRIRFGAPNCLFGEITHLSSVPESWFEVFCYDPCPTYSTPVPTVTSHHVTDRAQSTYVRVDNNWNH